ncbi:acyclic terpene utilization AtuA family protein [Arenibacterium sp. CAU 1754]
MKTDQEPVRIGGASGFWGDAAHATRQLLDAGNLDFVVYDYLAEITMAILARMRAGDESLGYATDFVTGAMARNLGEIARQGVRIVSNAGGVNPLGCAAALRGEIARQRLDLRVAVVRGDDLMVQRDDIAARAPSDMFTGASFPAPGTIQSINAYLGAFPIAQALDTGADIVITGRCVDSAVTLGACIHAFGWGADQLDQLAGGSLAGHILECGPQATGGNFTDWKAVPGGMADIGYPIAEISADGSFEVSKPAETGGLVSPATVGEQMLYEIGDPQSYVLPDVVCDFSDVTLVQTAEHRVRVCGAKGRGAPDSYKTCLIWQNGYRGGHLFSFYGIEAEEKARAFAEAAISRARKTLHRWNAPDFSEVDVELIGAETQFGALRQSGPAREVAAKIAVKHPDARAVALFLKEATGLGLATPPGLSGFAGARPRPSPVMALFSFPTPKSDVEIVIEDATGARRASVEIAAAPSKPPHRPDPPAQPDLSGEVLDVPLIDLAWARSGDKGDIANIGVIARHETLMPFIWHALCDDHLRRVFGHFLKGRIERFYLPGSLSMNILLHDALGGGGTRSLRNDPQAKGYAQLLLAAPIPVDRQIWKGLR